MREPLRQEIRAAEFRRIDVVEQSPSTNSELLAAVRAEPGAWPAPSALVTEHQTAGRGRAGRAWQTPPRAALTVSVLLRPAVPAERLGWLPLLAGACVVRAVLRVPGRHDDGPGAGPPPGPGRADGPGDLAVKWPNDVLVRAGTPVAGLGRYRKIAGVLAEVVPGTGVAPGEHAAVVLGIGINVSQAAGELPVETASSLALSGFGDVDRTSLLETLLAELSGAVARWEAADGDPGASGLAAECARVSATLGTRVRAELAGGAGTIEGTATALTGSGALTIRAADGTTHDLTAGDVHHLR